MRSLEIERLARSFADTAVAFLGLVENLQIAQWEKPAIGDGRPIGTIAHHVALGYAIGTWRIVAAQSGYPQPLQLSTADERNAAHAAATPSPDRAITVMLLRTGGASLEAGIRSLRPSQLEIQITIGAFKETIATLVESCRSHVLEHDATIRKSIAV